MAFADEVVKDGRAYAMRFDVSTDEFATISYRWSTHGGTVNVATEDIYTNNVIEVGSLARGFGFNGVSGASGMELVLDNTDGGQDWMFNRLNYYAITRMRIRAYLILWDAAAGWPTSAVEKQVGDFYLGDMPRRDEGRVTLNLVDAIIGRLDGNGYRLPTIEQFASAYAVSTGEQVDYPRDMLARVNIPMAYGQVQMGGPWLLGLAAGATGNYRLLMPFRSGGSTTTNFTLHVVSQVGTPLESWFEVPSRAVLSDGSSSAIRTIWETANQTVTDGDGTSRTVRYLTLHVPWFVAWTRVAMNVTDYTYSNVAVDLRASPSNRAPRSGTVLESLVEYLSAFADVSPLHYNATLPNVSAIPATYDATLFSVRAISHAMQYLFVITQNTVVHGTDVLAGVIDAIAQAPARATSTFSLVKTSLPDAKARGLVFSNGDIRALVDDIAGSHDIDVYATWAGTIGVSADTFEAALAGGLITAHYSDTDVVTASSDWPGIGERGYAYSHFVPDTARLALGVSVEAETVTSDGRGGTLVIRYNWNGGPVNTRRLVREGRPRLRFVTDLRGMTLELGDFFQFTWTRGVATAFSGAYFQVQRLRFDYTRGQVEVEALWRKDDDTPWAYMLDDQTMHTKATGSGGRTATVTDSSTTVTFSSGSLVTDGVAAGDILVLLDSTLAADNFTRFRALRISAVGGATTLTVTDADLDFDTPGGTAVSSWEIRAGALSVNEPTGVNYAAVEWEKYGKAADVAVGGTFSDTTTKANRFGGG